MLDRLSLRRWIRGRRQDDAISVALSKDFGTVVSEREAGRYLSLECPLDRCVAYNGFRYGSNGWHPFVKAAMLFAAGRDDEARRCLRRFYACWQPKDALDSMCAKLRGPQAYVGLPPYFVMAPWVAGRVDDRLESLRQIIHEENAAHGAPGLGESGGYGLQGPVSPEKLNVELRRISSAVRAMRDCGYDRSYGDLQGQLLLRDGDWRCRIVHGHHRAAALSALGVETAPMSARFVVRRERVSEWPQVRAGLWDEVSALAYFDHHFDFDSNAWAAGKGLGA